MAGGSNDGRPATVEALRVRGDLLGLEIPADSEALRAGGPPLRSAELKLHLHLYIAMMGLTWLMDVPALIEAQVPDLIDVGSRFDPRVHGNEAARVRLHMMSTFLHLWETQRFGTLLERMRTSCLSAG